jgi:large subunit ribosomal protein L6e
MVSKTYKNPQAREPLAPSVPRFARSQQYHRKGVWALIKVGAKPAPKPATAEEAPKTKKFSKKEQTRTIQKKFSTRRIVAQKRTTTKKPVVPRLRASIVPGTVLILLAGRFAGKRVVFLKQLQSGLLLVTGPYLVNGVPLKRVNQAYVIATSTRVDISGVKIPDTVNDSLWKKPKASKDKSESNFFREGKKKELPATFVELQKTVDDQVIAAVDKVQHLKAYLSQHFTLSNGVYPHALKF